MTGTDADEETRRQAERLALLAALARPVQHDLNNLLTVIFANLDLLKRRVADEAPLRQIGRVQEATRRFEASTRAILSLARRPVPGLAVTSPAAAIAALEPLLALLLPTPGALTLALPPDCPPSGFDQALLDTALLGLARDSAGRGGLHLAVTAASDQVRLEVTLPDPAGPGTPVALAALEALAATAGGTLAEMPAEAGTRRLCLTLPVAAVAAPGG